MKLTTLDRAACLELAFERPDELLRRIEAVEIFVARRFVEPEAIEALRDRSFETGRQSPPSWHPLVEGCPDYHRLHDDYPKAHVKARMHAFYYHGYYERNAALFALFAEVFALKNRLGGFARDAHLRDTPDRGQVARVLLHHYPRGGGYQAEHVDPVSPFAKVQTIVQASRFGHDFHRGGVYARCPETGRAFHVDPQTEPGDLILMSPGIRHGVGAVDGNADYSWQTNDGRWMAMPIIVASDRAPAERPRQV